MMDKILEKMKDKATYKMLYRVLYRTTNRVVGRSLVCPFCFSEYKKSGVEFRCQNYKCDPEIDEVYARFRDITPVRMNRTFSDISRKGKCRCPHCGELSSNRICPNCHNDLPYTTGKYRDLNFAFIGAKFAGKSHYVAVLIDSIKKHISDAFNANLQSLDDNTSRRYREEFYKPVFKDHKVIAGTQSARANINVKIPLIYSLSFMRPWLFGLVRNRISDVSTLAFFDTAGEDLNAMDTMRTENKYIYNSHGIILLVDPLQVPEIRDQLSSRLNLPPINAETEDIVERVANLIRTASKYTDMRKKIDIPIALVFSKIDAMEELLEDNKFLFSAGDHNGYFNLTDAKNVNDVIEGFMKEFGGSGFLNTVRHNFNDYAFFGISALGSVPDGQDIPKLRPIRVEDPFLWLLYKHGIIEGKQV